MTDSKFKRHFFVCVMQRPPMSKPSCGAQGGNDVYSRLMEGLGAHQDLWGDVSVTTTGCMGPCFVGPIVCVYPEGAWYAGVKVDDVKQIVDQHLVGGEVVERLAWTWPEE
jgi:(2Fe-2S) ferredoxin